MLEEDVEELGAADIGLADRIGDILASAMHLRATLRHRAGQDHATHEQRTQQRHVLRDENAEREAKHIYHLDAEMIDKGDGVTRHLDNRVGALPLGRLTPVVSKYSPDLNPIEQVFAKLKHLLRKASARTREAVCAAIGHLLAAFNSDACANYLKNSGYDRA